MSKRLAGWSLAVVGALALLMGGCAGGGMGRYNVRVTPGETLRGRNNELPSMEVDLVGVNETQVAAWEAYPVSDYFSGGDQRRRDAREYTHTMRFTNDEPGPQTLARNDPMWDKWERIGATKLVILANAPGLRPAPGGGPDPRRLILPLDRSLWDSATLDVVVQPSGVENRTPMNVDR